MWYFITYYELMIFCILYLGFIGYIIYVLNKKSGKRGDELLSKVGRKVTAARKVDTKKEEEKYLKKYITEIMVKNGRSAFSEIKDVIIKRFVLSLVFAIITLLNALQMIFYHNLVFLNVIIEIAITIVYIFVLRKITTVGVIKKQILAGKDDNMEYIIVSNLQNIKNGLLGKIASVIAISICVAIPIFIARTPHIIYEDQGSSYAVRYYTLSYNPEIIVTIPEYYEGKPVTSIRGSVFLNMDIKVVFLPETITEIRGEAFKNCKQLQTINIPKGVTEIKGNTFQNCESLKEIEIPEGVTRIGGHAFDGCRSLTYVDIPSSVIELGKSAFRNCTKLKRVDIPYYTRVQDNTFKNTNAVISKKRLD